MGATTRYELALLLWTFVPEKRSFVFKHSTYVFALSSFVLMVSSWVASPPWDLCNALDEAGSRQETGLDYQA